MLLAVVPTWPLVQQLSTSLPGEGIGDNVAFLWNFWWMRQAGTSFFFASGLFAPYGVDLALHTHTALQGAVAATLLGRLDVVTAQNVVIIATLVLNGLCTYAFAWNRTRSIGGALVAGAIVAASPFVSAHLLGHFNLINVWPIPLAILASLRALETQSMKWSIAAGVMLAVLAYTDYYYLVYCLVVLAGLVLWRTGILAVTFHPRSLSRRARFALLVPLVLIAALSAAIVMSGGVDTTFAGVRVRASQPGNLLAAGWLLAAVAAWKRWRPSMRLDRTRWHDVVGDLQTFLPGAAAFAVLVSPILVHATVLVAAGDYSAPAHKWRSGPGGIDLLTLFIGSPFNAATGRWTQSVYEHSASTGWKEWAGSGSCPLPRSCGQHGGRQATVRFARSLRVHGPSSSGRWVRG